MKGKTFIITVCIGLTIHAALTAAVLIDAKKKDEAQKKRSETVKEVWADCKEVLSKLMEKQQTNDKFWEQVKAEFPEDYMGT